MMVSLFDESRQERSCGGRLLLVEMRRLDRPLVRRSRYPEEYPEEVELGHNAPTAEEIDGCEPPTDVQAVQPDQDSDVGEVDGADDSSDGYHYDSGCSDTEDPPPLLERPSKCCKRAAVHKKKKLPKS